MSRLRAAPQERRGAPALVPALLLGRLLRVLAWPVTVEVRTGRWWRRVQRENVRGLAPARARVRELAAELGRAEDRSPAP